MVYPKRLNIGDKVGIIAPAGAVNTERQDKTIEKIKEIGLIPVEGRSFRARNGYLAGEDSIRAEDINDMFSRRDIAGIFCARGGYGSQRIIDLIDWEMIKKNPKIFTGYSDITALHYCINTRCNFITYHSPMFSSELCIEDKNSYSFKEFIARVFSNENSSFEVINPKDEEIKVMIDGNSKGILTGGNLSMITSSIGTDYEVNTEGKVLFLEEIGESLYKIDKMLNQLKNSNKLKYANGFIIGYFIESDHNSKYEADVIELIKEYLLPLNKPAVYNVCCGHRLPNGTLPMGSEARIKKNRIWFEE